MPIIGFKNLENRTSAQRANYNAQPIVLQHLIEALHNFETDTGTLFRNIKLELFRCSTNVDEAEDDIAIEAESANLIVTQQNEEPFQPQSIQQFVDVATLPHKDFTQLQTELEDKVEEFFVSQNDYISEQKAAFNRAKNNFTTDMINPVDKKTTYLNYKKQLLAINNNLEAWQQNLNDHIQQCQINLYSTTPLDFGASYNPLEQAVRSKVLNEKSLSEKVATLTDTAELLLHLGFKDNQSKTTSVLDDNFITLDAKLLERHQSFQQNVASYVDQTHPKGFWRVLGRSITALSSDTWHYIKNTFVPIAYFDDTILRDVLNHFGDLECEEHLRQICKVVYGNQKEATNQNDAYIKNEIFIRLLLELYCEIEQQNTKQKLNLDQTLESLATDLNRLAYCMGTNLALLEHAATKEHRVVLASAVSTNEHSLKTRTLKFGINTVLAVIALTVSVGILTLVFAQSLSLLGISIASPLIAFPIFIALVSAYSNLNLFYRTLVKGVEPLINNKIEPGMSSSRKLLYYSSIILCIGGGLIYGALTFLAIQKMLLLFTAFPFGAIIAIAVTISLVTAVSTIYLYLKSFKSIIKDNGIADFINYCKEIYYYSFAEALIKNDSKAFFASLARAIAFPFVSLILFTLGTLAAWAAFSVARETSVEILLKLPEHIKGSLEKLTAIVFYTGSVVSGVVEFIFNFDLVLSVVKGSTYLAVAVPFFIVAIPISLIRNTFAGCYNIYNEGLGNWLGNKFTAALSFISNLGKSLSDWYEQAETNIAKNHRLLLRPFTLLNELFKGFIIFFNAIGNAIIFAELILTYNLVIDRILGIGSNFFESLAANLQEVDFNISNKTDSLKTLLEAEPKETIEREEKLATEQVPTLDLTNDQNPETDLEKLKEQKQLAAFAKFNDPRESTSLYKILRDMGQFGGKEPLKPEVPETYDLNKPLEMETPVF